MTKFKEWDTVIVCECGPVEEGAARLATIASIRDGVAWVDGKSFPLDSSEPWDVSKERTPQRRYIMKPDTPDNRLFYGLSAPA